MLVFLPGNGERISVNKHQQSHRDVKKTKRKNTGKKRRILPRIRGRWLITTKKTVSGDPFE